VIFHQYDGARTVLSCNIAGNDTGTADFFQQWIFVCWCRQEQAASSVVGKCSILHGTAALGTTDQVHFVSHGSHTDHLAKESRIIVATHAEEGR